MEKTTSGRGWKARVVKTKWKEVSWVVGRKAFLMALCRSRPAAEREPRVGTDIQGNRGAVIGEIPLKGSATVIWVNVGTWYQ